MVRTLVGMQHVPLTFDPTRILTMRVPFAETRYPAPDDRARFLRALLARVAALPGVQAATVDSGLPFVGARRTAHHGSGAAEDRSGVAGPRDDGRLPADPAGQAGRRTRAGRGGRRRRASRGRRQSRFRAQVLRRRVADRSAGSARLSRAPAAGVDRHRLRIVGVIDDLRNQGPARDPAPEIYVPFGINGRLYLSDRGGARAAAAARAHRAGRGAMRSIRSSR